MDNGIKEAWTMERIGPKIFTIKVDGYMGRRFNINSTPQIRELFLPGKVNFCFRYEEAGCDNMDRSAK